MIIIENKILAEISESINEDETKVTQLEKYLKGGVMKIILILSIQNYMCCSILIMPMRGYSYFFQKISYNQLFNNLKKLKRR